MVEEKYRAFRIPKRSGGFREILAPDEDLKAEQRRILNRLYEKTKPPFFCKGFLKGVSIYDNARQHKSKKYILNVDVKDFFSNCKKENLPEEIKRVLTAEEINLVFYRDYLPQGAPTSPYIANFYLKEADSAIYYLLKLHISDDVIYTRYADDITVSSNSKAIFSRQCLNIIKSILEYHGFEINTRKIRYMHPGKRKEITGLCVNSGVPTVSRKFRQTVRAAIHNYTTGKRNSREDLNRIKGWLAFLASVPAHRQQAMRQLHELLNERKQPCCLK